MNFNDTIAALSTPIGKGGVAVIRICGDEAISVAEKVFFPKSGKKLSELKPNFMTYGEIKADGETVDDGLADVFRAPRSFTGEDTVEINCHGGILVSRKVLYACFSAGARQAYAGEFTRRAFVSGKMGLTQAEALSSLLEARNDEQLRLSRNNLSGKIKEKCDGIYDRLAGVLANIYAKVDFPDEDLASMTQDEAEKALSVLHAEIKKLSATYKTGHAVMEGVRTVICGKPNVGKSSLYNRLVGRDAAIVTDREGTTRDLLFETVTLGRVTLRLCDTAGIRKTEDEVEKIGVERAKRELEKAELVLAVFDGSVRIDEKDLEIIDDIKVIKAAKVAVINKYEEDSMIDESIIKDNFDRIVRLSAKENRNIEELVKTVGEIYINEEIDTANDAVIINARQNAALEKAAKHIESSLEALRAGFSADVAGVDVELAMSELSEMDGREVNEDIVSEIFSHFCVGK